MSAEASGWIWARISAVKTGTAKVVALYLADQADEWGVCAHISQRRMVDKLGFSIRAVRDALDQLEGGEDAEPLIKREEISGAKGREIDRITVLCAPGGPPANLAATPRRPAPLPPGKSCRYPPANSAAPSKSTNSKPQRSDEEEEVLGDRGSKADAPRQAASPAQGTRIRFGWVASSAERQYASERGFSPAEIDAMEEAFYDFWKAKPGKDGLKSDWSATWRTWVRNQRDGRYGPRGGSRPAGGPDPRDQRIGNLLGGAMAAAERRRRQE